MVAGAQGTAGVGILDTRGGAQGVWSLCVAGAQATAGVDVQAARSTTPSAPSPSTIDLEALIKRPQSIKVEFGNLFDLTELDENDSKELESRKTAFCEAVQKGASEAFATAAERFATQHEDLIKMHERMIKKRRGEAGRGAKREDDDSQRPWSRRRPSRRH